MATPRLPGPEALEEAARSFCTFRLGDALYGIDVGLVQSVNALPPLTPIPHAPASVRGYVNLRGQVHLVLDLARLLGAGETPVGTDTRLVLLGSVLGDPFGVLADRIGEILTLRPEQIEARAVDADNGAGLIDGIGKAEGELVIILNARRFLRDVRQSLAADTGGAAS